MEVGSDVAVLRAGSGVPAALHSPWNMLLPFQSVIHRIAMVGSPAGVGAQCWWRRW